MEEHRVPLLHVQLYFFLVVHAADPVVHLVDAVLPLGVLVLVELTGAGKERIIFLCKYSEVLIIW